MLHVGGNSGEELLNNWVKVLEALGVILHCLGPRQSSTQGQLPSLGGSGPRGPFRRAHIALPPCPPVTVIKR